MIEVLQVSPSTIARVRKRFVTEGFGAALDHRPQPPRPEKVKLTDSIEKQLIQLACSDPPQGRCCWTLELLADRLVALGCVKAVSREAVARCVKKNDVQPWVVRTWCLPPKADADFVWHMEDVLQVYQIPYDPTHPVVCLDEASKQLIGEFAIPVPCEPGALPASITQYGLPQGDVQLVHDVRAIAGLAARAGDGAAHPPRLGRMHQGRGCPLSGGREDPFGDGQPEHAQRCQSV